MLGAVVAGPNPLTVYFAGNVAVLAAQFTAVGATPAVTVSPGVTAGVVVASPTTGAPTSAVVVVEGSNDGNTWIVLPAPSFAPFNATFTLVRLRCSALAGGTSPTISATAIATP